MVHEFRPSGFGEAVLAFVLRATLKLLLKPVFSTRCSIGFQRRWLAGLSKIAIGTRGVGVTAGTVGGVPGEWSRRYRGARPARQHPVPARRRLLRGQPGHAPGPHLAAGAGHRVAGVRRRLPAGAGTSLSCRTGRCRGRLPGPARGRPGHPDGRFRRGRSGAGHGTGLARRGRSGPGGPGAVLALGGPGQPSPPPPAPPGEAMLSWGWTGACARHYVGPDAPAALRPAAGLAPARRPARPAAGADPGRHRRAAAPPGAGAARGPAGRRRGRALRDHGTSLACVSAARQCLAQRQRRHRPRGPVRPRAAGRRHAAQGLRAPGGDPGCGHVGPVHGDRAAARRASTTS
jgi:hypothetical protein